jgi:hypothetical protein
MRFRLGLVIGFGAGYYLGTAAGRERYEEINRALRKLKRSEAYETASDKAKAVVDLGKERAKDVVEEKIDLATDKVADKINDLSDKATGGSNGTSGPEKTWPEKMDPIVRP